MTGQSFIQGTLILILGNLLNRVLGFVDKVVMIRIIHPEGIGLLNMIYPAYVLFLVMASAGIPVAIAKLVAEEVARHNLAGAYRIFRVCLITLIFSSILFTMLYIHGAPLLLKYVFVNPKAYYSFLCLLPCIIIVTLCSAFRGFYQGLQQMMPTALTQFLEQLARVTFGLLIAYLLMPHGVEYAAMGAALGVVIGELTGFIAILAIYLRSRPRLRPCAATSFEPLTSIAGRVFSLAYPVTLTRCIATSLIWADAALIPLRLQAGGSGLSEATDIFGQLAGISLNLLFSPGIITVSLATALLPAISDAMALNNLAVVQARCAQAIRITILVGVPCALVLFILARDICGIVFGYPQAGTSLSILALGAPFLYLWQTTTGILQGLGEAYKPLRNLVIASIFKIAGIYYLTALPQFGIRGTAAAFSIGYFLMALLNLADIQQLIKLKLSFYHFFLLPAAAAAGMGLMITSTYWSLYAWSQLAPLATAGAICTGFAAYLTILLISGEVKLSELQRLKHNLGHFLK
ncbi:MAG: Stage V sporulation protein B [Pelotomaculum sp. PtaB.Bin104]|nr:MAG: Stage V sporulation protein B [Pelotomaculum sp. PtaB.Bin104]